MTRLRELHILGFAGSLRKLSYNRGLIAAARELAPADMRIEIWDIAEIPLYNGDVEAAGDPPPVVSFKAAMRSADALLIATPEYNYGIPGVAKNAIDWASRPARQSPLNGKPVGIMGASPGMAGTARAQLQLRQAFTFTDSYCMPQPELLVARAAEKFDAQSRLTDQKTRELLGAFLLALSAWTRRFVT
jgi:chromate reductase